MNSSNILVNKLGGLCAFFVLAACTPADMEYCNTFGVAGTAEYSKCISFYQQEQAAFSADHAVCAIEADDTYPRSLYDSGGFAHVGIGSGFGDIYGRGYGGGFGGGVVSVPPDFRHNAEVDRLRARILTPCMQQRGWNSPNSWQAGRSEVKPQKRRAGRTAPAPLAPAQKLPWLK